MPAPPKASLMCMNVTWECQIVWMAVSLSTEQGSGVNCDPFPPLQTNGFMTFNVDNLSINISSTGTPVTPVTHNFESGHRHTLLVWAPSNYQVVSSWAFPAASDCLCCWRHGCLVVDFVLPPCSIVLDNPRFLLFQGHSHLTSNKGLTGGWEVLIGI